MCIDSLALGSTEYMQADESGSAVIDVQPILDHAVSAEPASSKARLWLFSLYAIGAYLQLSMSLSR